MKKVLVLVVVMLGLMMLVGCSGREEVRSWTNRYTGKTEYSGYLDEWKILVIHSYVEGSRQFTTEEISNIWVIDGVLEVEFKDNRVQVYHGDYRFYFLEEK